MRHDVNIQNSIRAKSLWRFLIVLFLGLSTSLLAASKPTKAFMPNQHMKVVEKYCLECHDADTEKGSFNMEDLSFEISIDNETAEWWDKVLAAINAGEMPPEDEPQMTSEEKSNFLEDLSLEMVKARKLLSDSGGYIALRRLNQREYQNSLEHLLGFKPDVSLLPNDQQGSGFDTFGASLFFSSDQFELYYKTAQNALRDAMSLMDRAEPKKYRGEAEDQLSPYYINLVMERMENFKKVVAFHAQDEKTPEEMGFIDIDQVRKSEQSFNERMNELFNYFVRPEVTRGAPMIYFTKFGKKAIWTPKIKTQVPGKYILRTRVASYKDAPLREQYIEYGRQVNGSSQNLEILGYKKIVADVDDPEIVEFEIDHEPGMKGQYFVRPRSYKLKRDRFAMLRRAQLETGKAKVPSIWVDYVELEGPFIESTKSIEMKNYLVESKDESSVENKIAKFAKRVFRGDEPSRDYLNQLMNRYRDYRDQSLSVTEAMLDVYAIILSSPSFLYMVETKGEGVEEQRLKAKEVAVRLSYFLWSSPPDAELMTLANSGKLLNPKVLKAQTHRLLKDSRSDAFIHNFTHQWLDMERVDMFNFDSDHYPNFDEAIRNSARHEVYATLREVLNQKLPLSTLLKSDFVMINEVLSDYYGIGAVKGEGFQKVQLPKHSPRGGMLGMAAVHIMGSDGIKSSPVERGVWVLRHLLNDPPPPAPANVPMLDRFDEMPMGARELQKIHMEEPQCAQCHKKIDPIGFGLENFDAAGVWREKELVRKFHKSKVVKYNEFEVDPKGQLPNKTEFKDYYELRDAVAANEAAFAEGFVEALIGYGLGRPFSFSDKDLLDRIVEQASEGHKTVDSFIHALVQSDAFQSR